MIFKICQYISDAHSLWTAVGQSVATEGGGGATNCGCHHYCPRTAASCVFEMVSFILLCFALLCFALLWYTLHRLRLPPPLPSDSCFSCLLPIWLWDRDFHLALLCFAPLWCTFSVTETEFCIPDHGSQTALMAKFRAFMRNPDLFRTTFWTFPDF